MDASASLLGIGGFEANALATGMPRGVAPLPALIDDREVFMQATAVPALRSGWARVRVNAGAAGGDRMTIDHFKVNLERRLAVLSDSLRDGTYLPSSLRAVEIPKTHGGATRQLNIPSVVDRVTQSAVVQELSPLLDAEFEDASFGYRSGRGVKDAVRRVAALRGAGAAWVVDADIENFFDSVPHDKLLERLADSMTPGPLTQLIALWLEHSGSKGRGLAQGSPLSPLLANLYLDRIDEAFSSRGARMVRYADDFVILCRSADRAEAALVKAKRLLAEQGLTLNEEKTQVVSFERGFRFLGHLFSRSLVLASPVAEDEGRMEEVLRKIAQADVTGAAADKRAESRREAEVAAGYQHRRRILYLLSPSRRLAVRNRSFSVQEAEGGGGDPVEWRELLALPHHMVERIEVGAGSEVVSDATLLALETGTPIARVDGHGQTLGWSAPALSLHPTRQLAQARTILDPSARLALARIFVQGRLRNQRALLRRLNYKRRNAEIAKSLTEINRLIRKVTAAQDIATLMGWEGRGAALYWRSFAIALPAGVRFASRRRGGKCDDKANALLNLAAALLARDVAAAIWRVGLNPGLGVLHATNDLRDAAVFDLIEEFRAPLAESTVAYALNNRIVRSDTDGSGLTRLDREDVSAFIRVYERAVGRVLKYPRTGQRRSWREIIGEQARLLAAHVEGDAVYEPMIMDY